MKYIGEIEFDKTLQGKDVVIYGAGQVGKEIFMFLKNNNLEKHVKFFCVTNLSSEEDILGIPVKNVRELETYKDEVDVLVGGKYAYSMMKTLQDIGVDRFHIYV